jgi:hypothetical protein
VEMPLFLSIESFQTSMTLSGIKLELELEYIKSFIPSQAIVFSVGRI